jgi:hypothetical protein
MKRKIQIKSGQYPQDRGSYDNHLDEPCLIHENSKHTARKCLVLKKFRRPLTAAHRRRLNQESSPDRLAFQVAHTTVSQNYPQDVPPQDGETDMPHQERENANVARAIGRQQEVTAPAADLQPANVGQVNANPAQ